MASLLLLDCLRTTLSPTSMSLTLAHFFFLRILSCASFTSHLPREFMFSIVTHSYMHFRKLVPQFTTDQHLRWTHNRDSVRSRPVREQEFLQFFRPVFLLYFSDPGGFHHCLVKTFHFATALWPVRETFRVLYP